MQIKLKSLSITNFKGIESFKTQLDQFSTFVYGDNGTGKTSVLDAFLWLFFGKNSEGEAKFEVKRLDASGQFIKEAEAEVEAIVNIDGVETSIKKVLRQKWIRRRGDIEPEYKGDESVYYWNDVPLKESEFKSKTSGIIQESLFRMITNPLYFNSLPWKERRDMLVNIAGSVSNDDVMKAVSGGKASKEHLEALMIALNKGKSLDEYKAEMSSKKKKVLDEKENLPARIDEVRRAMPADRDYVAIEAQLSELSVQRNDLLAAMNSAVEQQNQLHADYLKAIKQYQSSKEEHQKVIFMTKGNIQALEFEAHEKATQSQKERTAKIDSIKRRISAKEAELKTFTDGIATAESMIAQKEEQLISLRNEWSNEDAKTIQIDESQLCCPTCKQELPADQRANAEQTLTANFNRAKAEKLNTIHGKANSIKSEIENLKARLENGRKSADEIKQALATDQAELETAQLDEAAPLQPIKDVVTDILAENSTYQTLTKNLSELEAKVWEEPVKPTTAESDSSTKQKIDQIEAQSKALMAEYATKAQRDAAEQRLAELMRQESKLSQELLELEGIEFAIMEFTKAKVDVIESRINGKFKHVRFRMFEKQVNGGEKETCETLVNTNGSWVPFTDGNNAGKINAGLDIINTLCEFYNVYAPIFIDNRESVTKLIECSSQVINLVVSEQDKKLRVA